MSKNLPTGWSIKTLCEVADVVSGGTPSRSQAKFWKDGSIEWITPTDITACQGRTIMGGDERITPEGLRCSSAHLLPVGSLLLTSRATLGEIRIAGKPMCTNQGFKSLIPRANVDNWFLYYQMLAHRSRYACFGIGTTFLEVNKRDTERFKLPMAEEAEQPLISIILRNIDDAIEHTDALISKYQSIKQGMMLDLFTRGVDENGKLRPPYEEAPELYKKTGLGLVPKVWDVDVLDNLTDVTKLAGFEFTNFIRYDPNGEVIALRALNIKNERLDLGDIQRISRRSSEALPRSKVYKNDVLITYIGAYIGDVLMIEDSGKYHLAPNVAKITSRGRLVPRFLELILRTANCRRQMSNFTAVTATPSLTMTQIRGIKVAFPQMTKEQERIAFMLKSVNDALESNEKTKEKLANLKHGLMRDLLTGEVRVPANLFERKAA